MSLNDAKGLSWAQLEDVERWPAGARRSDIAAAAELIEASLKPAGVEEIALWVEFLLSRYRARPDAPGFADMDKHMWLAVIGHWPLDVLQAAVTAWCGESRPFPPSVPGELKALGEPILVQRLSLKFRAERMLSAPEPSPHDEISADLFSQLKKLIAPAKQPSPSATALTRALAPQFPQRRVGLGERGAP